MAENKCLFYDAKEVFEMLGLKESKGYTYLDKAMVTGKPSVALLMYCLKINDKGESISQGKWVRL